MVFSFIQDNRFPLINIIAELLVNCIKESLINPFKSKKDLEVKNNYEEDCTIEIRGQ